MVGPPTSPPDPGPINTHDHEWRLAEDAPIIEDGAAIFYEHCEWVEITGSAHSEKHDETFYETGAECEETRTYRFEYSTLESPSGKTWELPDITEWDDHNLPEKHAEKVITIEERFHGKGPSEKVNFDVDPDPDNGQVTITYKGWELHFRP